MHPLNQAISIWISTIRYHRGSRCFFPGSTGSLLWPRWNQPKIPPKKPWRSPTCLFVLNNDVIMLFLFPFSLQHTHPLSSTQPSPTLLPPSSSTAPSQQSTGRPEQLPSIGRFWSYQIRNVLTCLCNSIISASFKISMVDFVKKPSRW